MNIANQKPWPNVLNYEEKNSDISIPLTQSRRPRPLRSKIGLRQFEAKRVAALFSRSMVNGDGNRPADARVCEDCPERTQSFIGRFDQPAQLRQKPDLAADKTPPRPLRWAALYTVVAPRPVRQRIISQARSPGKRPKIPAPRRSAVQFWPDRASLPDRRCDRAIRGNGANRRAPYRAPPIARQPNNPKIRPCRDESTADAPERRSHRASAAKQVRGFDDLQAPLFIIDAESMVIFCPMLQFGVFQRLRQRRLAPIFGAGPCPERSGLRR